MRRTVKLGKTLDIRYGMLLAVRMRVDTMVKSKELSLAFKNNVLTTYDSFTLAIKPHQGLFKLNRDLGS